MNAAIYVIEQRGDQWCLLTHDGSHVIGCHDTKEGAEAQERAIQAAKSGDTYSLTGVEIFKAGVWNGDEYGVEDLDAMVEAASQVGFTPALKAGHSFDDSQPALGWVENLRRKGESLFADLVALPKAVYEAILNRRYDAVSAEIYFDMKRNGKKYGRVLKGLALLGAEPPAVDLTPLRDFFALSVLPEARFSYYTVTLAATKTNDMEDGMEPDEEGNCPPGHEKGEDGKCRPTGGYTTTTTNTIQVTKGAANMADESTPPVDTKPGEIIVTLAQLDTLKRQAAKAERLESLEQALQERETQLAEVEARRQAESIAYRLRQVRIPAYRVHIKALYEMAAMIPTTKTFSLADPKVQFGAESVIDALVADLNRQAEHLFTNISLDTRHRANPDEPEETQAKITYRVNEYIRANKLDPAKDYKTALTAVLNADPELKEDYRQS